jgi:hypothetical protein
MASMQPLTWLAALLFVSNNLRPYTYPDMLKIEELRGCEKTSRFRCFSKSGLVCLVFLVVFVAFASAAHLGGHWHEGLKLGTVVSPRTPVITLHLLGRTSRQRGCSAATSSERLQSCSLSPPLITCPIMTGSLPQPVRFISELPRTSLAMD